jgi:hypothetical protein
MDQMCIEYYKKSSDCAAKYPKLVIKNKYWLQHQITSLAQQYPKFQTSLLLNLPMPMFVIKKMHQQLPVTI